MKFLLVILALRHALLMLLRVAKPKEGREADWENGPSEHNVWW
jgi:hypothetical protein